MLEKIGQDKTRILMVKLNAEETAKLAKNAMRNKSLDILKEQLLADDNALNLRYYKKGISVSELEVLRRNTSFEMRRKLSKNSAEIIKSEIKRLKEEKKQRQA